MHFRRLLAGGLGLAAGVALVSAYLYYLKEAEDRLDPADLDRRTALSKPAWANYDEDLKAQIGAGPVAQWKGRPVAARRAGEWVHVTFRLEGAWANRTVAIPVLVRDPSGNERRQREFEVRSPEVVYTFHLEGGSAEAPLPWIVVKYPHREERITLDAQGEWRAER